MDHRSFYGEKGFILKNGKFKRFEPIGISWNDSYCRRLTDAGPSGCFVERDLSTIPDFNYHGNNCSGKDSNLLGTKCIEGLLQEMKLHFQRSSGPHEIALQKVLRTT